MRQPDDARCDRHIDSQWRPRCYDCDDEIRHAQEEADLALADLEMIATSLR